MAKNVFYFTVKCISVKLRLSYTYSFSKGLNIYKHPILVGLTVRKASCIIPTIWKKEPFLGSRGVKDKI